VVKKFPRTKWADLADYHFRREQVVRRLAGQTELSQKETDIYEEYCKNHSNSPKVQEALLKAASRQAALIQIYATDEQPGKIPTAKQRAAALAKRAFDAKRIPMTHSAPSGCCTWWRHEHSDVWERVGLV